MLNVSHILLDDDTCAHSIYGFRVVAGKASADIERKLDAGACYAFVQVLCLLPAILARLCL